MNTFLFMQDRAQILNVIPELVMETEVENIQTYPFIREFGCLKFKKVVPSSLLSHLNKGIEICYIINGKYHWQVENKQYTLFPGDCFVTCPFEKHGGIKGHLDIGTLLWIIIEPEEFNKTSSLKLGKWSGLSVQDQKKMGEILKHKTSNKFINQPIKQILENLREEMIEYKVFSSRVVTLLVDRLLIETCRSIEKMRIEIDSTSDFVEKLDQFIMSHLHQTISVDKLASFFSMSGTSFNEKVKQLTGYSPINYVIYLKLERAKQLLVQSNSTITNIAHDCGFYSSQYFADTFKKWNGINPSSFRKDRS